MTLKEWRLKKGWSRTKLAEKINSRVKEKLKTPVAETHIQAWERGVMPAHDIGQIIDKISCNKIMWSRQ